MNARAEELRRAAQAVIDAGLEWVQLVVQRKRATRYWDRARLWAGGPLCRFIGELERGRWRAEVRAADLLAALA
jgi:hypothetical protein